MALDINAIRAKAAKLEQETSRTDFEYWKPKNGDNDFRILPPDADGVWYVGLGYHYEVGPNQETVVCPKITEDEWGGGKPCPICEVVSALYKTKDKQDRETAQELSSTRRYFFRIIDIEEPEKGVQIFPCGVTIFKEVLKWISHRDYGDVTDAEDGYDLTLNKKGKGRDTEYSLTPRKNPSPISAINGFDMDMLNKLPDLKGLVNIHPYEKIEGIFNGTDTGKSSGDDEEEDKETGKDRRGTSSKESSKPATSAKPSSTGKSSGDDLTEEQQELLENPPKKCFAKEFNPTDETCEDCDYRKNCRIVTNYVKSQVPFDSTEEAAEKEAVEEVVEEPKKDTPKAAGGKDVKSILASLKKK